MSTASMDRIGPARNATAACAMLAAIAGGSLLGGCSAPRTWPSVGAKPGFSADTPPMPQVVSDAIKYAHAQIAREMPLVYNLPEEMNPPAFAAFERALAPGKPMCPGDTNVWTVRTVRIDGSKAQVDIEYPSRDGFYQTVTVHLQGATAGIDYRPSYLQYWKVPVKEPVCQQPIEVVERACGADAAMKLRAQREALASLAPAGTQPAARASAPAAAPTPAAGAEEPSK